MNHPDIEALSLYLINPSSPAASEIEAHLAECTACRGNLEGLRDVEDLLRDEDSWNEEGAPSFSNIDEFAKRLENEDEDARRSLEHLELQDLALRAIVPALGHAGTVRYLSRRAHSLIESDPPASLLLANLATVVADALTTHEYPSTVVFALRGSARKEQANALRQLGKYPEALRTLDEAEANFKQTAVGDFDMAAVDYVRATVYYATGQGAKARELAAKSASVFREFGEVERYSHARLLEAAIFHEEGNTPAATDIFQELLQKTAESDVALRGRLLHNLAHCLITSDPDRASSYFQQAVTIYTDLGLATEAVRAQLGLARLLLTRGERDEGIRRLTAARDHLLSLGMVAAAAIAELDLIEVLLPTEEHASLEDRCRIVADTFHRAGMNPNAALAMQYLRDLFASGSATPAHIGYVKDFLHQCETDHVIFRPM